MAEDNKQIAYVLIGLGIGLLGIGMIRKRKERKAAKATLTIQPTVITPEPIVLPKDTVVYELIANVDKQIGLNEFDDTSWIDLYHQLHNAAELSVANVNGKVVLSTTKSNNVSNDAQTKAIAYLTKINQFQPTVNFWE